MNLRNISAIIIIVIGFLIYIFESYFAFFGTDGFIALLIGIPLLLCGIFLFFSYTASALIFLGMIFHLLMLKFVELNSFISNSGLIILIMGIIYGIIEGLMKLLKYNKKISKR